MQLTFILTLQSDYHIGAGHGLGSQVDSALLRDSDNIPVLRGSTIAGLLRDGLWQLLQMPVLRPKRKCQASGLTGDDIPSYCPKWADPCTICLVFGTPDTPKRWRISSARPIGAEKPLFTDAHWNKGQTGSQISARVRVNTPMRRAEAHKLFKQEEGNKKLAFTFTVECAQDTADAHDEAALIVAASRMVRKFGSARRRGRGECKLALLSVERWQDIPPEDGNWQEHLLKHFRGKWLDNKPREISIVPLTWTRPEITTVNAKRFRLIARLDEPVVISRRAEAGNIFDCSEIISGSTLLGALAQESAVRWDLSDPKIYTDFLNVFRRGLVRFSPLYPAYFREMTEELFPAIPTPLDLLVCKVHRKLDPNHSPPKSYVINIIPDECPVCKCNIPFVPLGGFVAVREDITLTIPKLCEEMHPRVNPNTQRVTTGNLFGYVALETGQYFIGEIWCQDDSAWKTLCQLTGVLKEKELFHLRLGKATRRGYGLVTAWLEPIIDTNIDQWRGKPLEQRVTNMTDSITFTLLTDTILTDLWGRFSQTFDEALLQEIIGEPVELIRTFCKAGYVDSFNNHLGLPRWRDISLKAGSAVGFKLSKTIAVTTLQACLKKIEEDGVGLRRNEGFGQVVFNHPVYQGGHGVVGTSTPIPDNLKLASLQMTSLAGQVKSEIDFMRNWAKDLRDKNKFDESLFREEKWDAVARWLFSVANKPIDELKSELANFGNHSLLTTVARQRKEHFTKPESKQALEHLNKWLDKAKQESHMLQRIAIQLLANRIAGSVERRGK